MNDAAEDESADTRANACPQCPSGELAEDGRCSAIDCPSYEQLDTAYESEMKCPWCGHEQRDIFEIDGAYTEDTTRVECGRCERPFDSTCSISYSFTTERVDLVAEAEKKRAAAEAAAKRLAERQAAVAAFAPGTRVRVTDQRFADFIRGRVGVVNDRPVDAHNPFVHVTLDPDEKYPKPFKDFFRPEELTRIEGDA